MTRIYIIIGLVVALLLGGSLGYAELERHRVTEEALRDSNATLQGNVSALNKKISTDAAVRKADDAQAKADIKDLQQFKETSRATIKGTKDPGHVALDADATQRVRDIFAQH